MREGRMNHGRSLRAHKLFICYWNLYCLSNIFSQELRSWVWWYKSALLVAVSLFWCKQLALWKWLLNLKTPTVLSPDIQVNIIQLSGYLFSSSTATVHQTTGRYPRYHSWFVSTNKADSNKNRKFIHWAAKRLLCNYTAPILRHFSLLNSLFHHRSTDQTKKRDNQNTFSDRRTHSESLVLFLLFTHLTSQLICRHEIDRGCHPKILRFYQYRRLASFRPLVTEQIVDLIKLNL